MIYHEENSPLDPHQILSSAILGKWKFVVELVQNCVFQNLCHL